MFNVCISSIDFLTDGPKCQDEKAQTCGKEKKVIPTLSDCLIGYASTPGHYSYRNPETGSYYIAALVKVVLENAHNMELVHMMMEVRKIVSKKTISSKDKNKNKVKCKQLPVEDNYLIKQLYFNCGQL